MSNTDERTTEPRTNGRPRSGEATASGEDPNDGDERERRIEELRAENRRLRNDYARGKHAKNRQTALALLGIGLAGIAAGIVFSSARSVLLALGATGVFGGVLTYFLSPERVMPATVGRSAYDAVNETGTAIRDELGLANVAVYAPVEFPTEETRAPVRLFVPQSPDYELPSDEALRSTFVAPDSDRRRGVALVPTAGRMVAEFERMASDELSSRPEELTAQLYDALVEQFEVVRVAEAEYDEGAQQIAVGVSGVAYQDETGFDHPVASFLGSGLAHGLDTAVTVETESVANGDSDLVVTCRW
ncbi:hypothetical protein NDI76_16255 [Halogeometricum sp. S1BR25-6]|uniref:DUF7982 domain-containing protein n=1 Tax=Halogeometricum salsisoli TaxID=2950536 RepID=A0ABU2GHK0_9EURY|nr:hypothetical protein [Halogeometricum sp. S1BR25-6]MDS0300300.1 hypothetical protein [Halogeometricum sp. S1BR25-6]